MRIASLSLLTILCLTLAVTPAMAGAIYENGHWNGTINAWNISNGFVVTDSYMFQGPAEIQDFHFVYWALPGDLLTSVEIDFGTAPFGSDIASLVLSPQTNTFEGAAPGGYDLYLASFTFSGVNSPASGYVTLLNAAVPSGFGAFWDENGGVGCLGDGIVGSCPSIAFENSVGSISSEAFTITGSTFSVPERSTLATLLGFGIFNLAAVLSFRRKFKPVP